MHCKSGTSSNLFSTVVENGYCIGCGACASVDSNIEIRFNEHRQYMASLKEGCMPSAAAERVCPFAEKNCKEDEIGNELYGDHGMPDAHIGRHVASYAGWVVEGDYRAKGSSGGLASWILDELLQRNLVDFVVHIASVEYQPGEPLFRYSISSRSEEVRAASKSRYYPIEMSGVLQHIMAHPGRYAITGIPCFIKALRLASRESEILSSRISFTIGIVCGHLKSTAFAELFSWQCGIKPENLQSIDFRTKLADRPASSYGVTVKGYDGTRMVSITKPTSELFGSNWGHGFFKYKACDFCDDVVGETADISIGDAWLPEYQDDSSGTNIVVVRSPQLHAIISEAREVGRLHLDVVTADKVVESQAGGFRHRRDGLAYRLYLEDKAVRWRPRKRVEASKEHLTPKLRKIYAKRCDLARESHTYFALAKTWGDLRIFTSRMARQVASYDKLYSKPFLCRVFNKVKLLISPSIK